MMATGKPDSSASRGRPASSTLPKEAAGREIKFGTNGNSPVNVACVKPGTLREPIRPVLHKAALCGLQGHALPVYFLHPDCTQMLRP